MSYPEELSRWAIQKTYLQISKDKEEEGVQ